MCVCMYMPACVPTGTTAGVFHFMPPWPSETPQCVCCICVFQHCSSAHRAIAVTSLCFQSFVQVCVCACKTPPCAGCCPCCTVCVCLYVCDSITLRMSVRTVYTVHQGRAGHLVRVFGGDFHIAWGHVGKVPTPGAVGAR